MDITLERILSLIPKKENGDYQHGALKAFANSIGLRSGNLISDWVKGRSESYKNYIYEVSAKYGVSVEWLRGETNDPYAGIKKEHALEKSELSMGQLELIELSSKMSDDELRKFIAAMKVMLGK